MRSWKPRQLALLQISWRRYLNFREWGCGGLILSAARIQMASTPIRKLFAFWANRSIVAAKHRQRHCDFEHQRLRRSNSQTANQSRALRPLVADGTRR